MSLAGKVALITGSSSGIGAAIAQCFAREGARLSLTGRDNENLQAVADECRSQGCIDVLTTTGDMTQAGFRRQLIQDTKSHFGKIDILVNNAGMVIPGPLLQVTEEYYDNHLDLNLKSPVMLSVLAAPHLIETKGCIVNISSVGSVTQADGVGIYCTSKAGLDKFTESLALELGPFGVRVNSVNPGHVPTRLVERGQVPDDIKAEKQAALVKATVLGREGTGAEIGEAVVFIASDKASYVTGGILIVDGGIRLTPGY